MAQQLNYGTGRRKTATARVYLRPGNGQHLLAQLVYISGDIRVVKHLEFTTDRIEQLFADQPFLADAETVRRKRQEKLDSRQHSGSAIQQSGQPYVHFLRSSGVVKKVEKSYPVSKGRVKRASLLPP